MKCQFTEGNLPFICGGENNGDDTNKCYKYDVTLDQWAISGTMPEDRAYSGFDSSEAWGLIMSGGQDDSFNGLESVLKTVNGEVFSSLPDLPKENDYSCVVIIDDDRIFTCGGRADNAEIQDNTYIFSKSNESWGR